MSTPAANYLLFRPAIYCREQNLSPYVVLITGCALVAIGAATLYEIPPFSSIGYKTEVALILTGVAVNSVAIYLHVAYPKIADCEKYKPDPSISFEDLHQKLTEIGNFVRDLDLAHCFDGWEAESKNRLLSKLPRLCPRLKSLSLSGCRLTAENRRAFIVMCQRLNALSMLSLSDNPLIQDSDSFISTMEYLAHTACAAKLERLFIGKAMGGDTDYPLGGIFEKLIALEELELGGASFIVVSKVLEAALEGKLPRLKILDLSSIDGVAEDPRLQSSLIRIFTLGALPKMPEFEQLILQGRSVTQADREALSAALTEGQRVDLGDSEFLIGSKLP